MWAELTAAHLDKPSELMALTEQLTVHEKDREKEASKEKRGGVRGSEKEWERRGRGPNGHDYDDK